MEAESGRQQSGGSVAFLLGDREELLLEFRGRLETLTMGGEIGGRMAAPRSGIGSEARPEAGAGAAVVTVAGTFEALRLAVSAP